MQPVLGRGRQVYCTNNNAVISPRQPPSSSQESKNYALTGQASALSFHSSYETYQYQGYQQSSVLFVPLNAQFPASQVQKTNPKSSKNSIKILDPVTNKDVTDEVLNEARTIKKVFPFPNLVSEFARKVAAVAVHTEKQNSTVTGSGEPTLKSSVGDTPVIPPNSTTRHLTQPVQPSLDTSTPQYSFLLPIPQNSCAPTSIPYFARSHPKAPLGTVYCPSPPPSLLLPAKLPLLDDAPLLTSNHKNHSSEHSSAESEIIQKSKKHIKSTINMEDLKIGELKLTPVNENKIMKTPGESETDIKNEEIKQQKENEKKSKHETGEIASTIKQNDTSETSPTLEEWIHSLIKNEKMVFTPSYMKECLPEEIKESKRDKKNAHTSLMTEIHVKHVEKNSTLKPQSSRYEENQWSPFNPDGKKCYSREFLLSLQSHPCSLRRPSTLPLYDIRVGCATAQRTCSSQNKSQSKRHRSRKSQHDTKS